MDLRELKPICEKLMTADTLDEIYSCCESVCSILGIDYFVYGSQSTASFVDPVWVILNGYPVNWIERYVESNYLVVDPIIEYCRKNMLPFSWDKLATAENKDKKVKQFMDESRDFSLKYGISFPIQSLSRDVALLSFASQKPIVKNENELLEMQLIGHYISISVHEAILKTFSTIHLDAKNAKLSKREKECLLWIAEGKTSWEAAKIMNIAERTVIFHLKNASEKLDVVNRQQAVARAVSLGLIEPVSIKPPLIVLS